MLRRVTRSLLVVCGASLGVLTAAGCGSAKPDVEFQGGSLPIASHGGRLLDSDRGAGEPVLFSGRGTAQVVIAYNNVTDHPLRISSAPAADTFDGLDPRRTRVTVGYLPRQPVYSVPDPRKGRTTDVIPPHSDNGGVLWTVQLGDPCQRGTLHLTFDVAAPGEEPHRALEDVTVDVDKRKAVPVGSTLPQVDTIDFGGCPRDQGK